MKKLGFLVILLPLIFVFSCKQIDKIEVLKANGSEIAEVYFASDGVMPISITSGVREEPYIYDGKSCDKLDFALIVADLNSSNAELVEVDIDGKKQDVIMEYNYLNGLHMADLGILLSGNEQISIKYCEQVSVMQCKSKNFKVSTDEALNLAYQNLKEVIDPLFSGKNFKGEIYLKVLDKLAGGFDEVYYLFSLMDYDGKMRNLLISTTEPKILADGDEIVI